MGAVDRLIAAGIRPDCAQETVMWYRAQGDDYGLEKYLNEVESRQDRKSTRLNSSHQI